MNVAIAPLPGLFAIARLGAEQPPPEWALQAPPPVFIARTSGELSVIARESVVPAGATAQRGYRALRVQGPLDFGLVGVMAALTRPLADAGISLLAVSTYDTDYLFVQDASFERALECLRAAGHVILLVEPAGA